MLLEGQLSDTKDCSLLDIQDIHMFFIHFWCVLHCCYRNSSPIRYRATFIVALLEVQHPRSHGKRVEHEAGDERPRRAFHVGLDGRISFDRRIPALRQLQRMVNAGPRRPLQPADRRSEVQRGEADATGRLRQRGTQLRIQLLWHRERLLAGELGMLFR